MRFIVLLVLLCTALAEVPSEEERAAIMECHEKLREEVQPTASNMQLLTYSTKLETVVLSILGGCGGPVPEYENVGYIQPLWHTRKLPYRDVLCNVDSSGFAYENDACEGSCYDYKQMVWGTSTQVGCARHRCQIGQSKELHGMACVYKPGDPYLEGKPYEQGPSCSKCLQGTECFRNQCRVPTLPKIVIAQEVIPQHLRTTELLLL
uniref:SCP domain-containing protein n=1 Tax=Mesocestoides corti TaxID=53468 RepID=A0A5K3EYB3_MESCO